MFAVYEHQRPNIDNAIHVQDFYNRFRQICQDHLRQDRAKTFGIILHNNRDDIIFQLVNDSNVISRLNKVITNEMTVFFLNTYSFENKVFNQYMLSLLSDEESDDPALPVVAFFNYKNRELSDIEYAYIDFNNIETALFDLSEIFEQKVGRVKKRNQRLIKIVKTISIATFMALFDEGIQQITPY